MWFWTLYVSVCFLNLSERSHPLPICGTLTDNVFAESGAKTIDRPSQGMTLGMASFKGCDAMTAENGFYQISGELEDRLIDVDSRAFVQLLVDEMHQHGAPIISGSTN